MIAALTDGQLEAVLGRRTGVRGPTLEEKVALRADYFRDLSPTTTPRVARQRLEPVRPPEAHPAALLDGLVALSRERVA